MRLFGRAGLAAVCLILLLDIPARAESRDAVKLDAKPPVAKRPKTEDGRPYGIPSRTLWTTSKVIGSPDPPLPYRLKRRFPKLKFAEPVYLTPEPGSNRLFVVERTGRILAINDDENASTTVEVGKIERPGFRNDVFSLVFHPHYAENGYVFVFVERHKELSKEEQIALKNQKRQLSEDEGIQIYRFELTREQPRRLIPDSGKLIINWASYGHSGGDLAFGPDGYLYVTSGDGTSGSDVDNTGQDISDLQASLLRLDIDHPEADKPYGIPKDNPFLNVKGARPEIWAFGLRQPWRISFDPPTDDLWVGEVGQDLWEMIHLVRRGGNYGWSVREGNHPFFTERKVGPAAISPPIVEHHHSESRSITGGYVYRGKRNPELAGMYLYCDYETGKVWGFRYEKGEVKDHRLLTDSTYRCASFGLDHAGEVYLIALSGEIFELEQNPRAADPTSAFPRELSQTGLFTDVSKMVPAPGLIPYAVNAEGWTDGAQLERYIAIPGTGQIEFMPSRGWNFPDESVLVQTVLMKTNVQNPLPLRRIETRILTRQEGQWAAYTYRWNDEQTDASLVDESGAEQKLTIADANAPGGTREMTWHIPSRSECMGCHSRAANWVLGLNTLQMNRDFHYGTTVDNQLRTLDHLALFTKPLDSRVSDYSKLANPYDTRADLNDRARAYLHANCSHCHVSDGGGNAKIEVEHFTEADETKMFDVAPLQGDFGLLDARIVAPGDPYRSVILYRTSKLGRGRMPRLGSSEVDERAMTLLRDWIAALPSQTTTAGDAKVAADLRKGDQAAIDLLRSAAAPSAAELTASVDRLLTTSNGSLLLLTTLNDGGLAAPIAKSVVERAAQNADAQVRDLFEKFLPESQRVKRLGNVFDMQQLLAMPGDVHRGEILFFKTAGIQCQNCHRIKGTGREVGPDLSQVGKKLDREKLLESIINPSKTVDEKFATYLVETTKGIVHSGLLVEKTDKEVVLKNNQNEVVRIPANEIELMIKQNTSLMPELLLRDVTAQQAADLLAFLSSLK